METEVVVEVAEEEVLKVLTHEELHTHEAEAEEITVPSRTQGIPSRRRSVRTRCHQAGSTPSLHLKKPTSATYRKNGTHERSKVGETRGWAIRHEQCARNLNIVVLQSAPSH